MSTTAELQARIAKLEAAQMTATTLFEVSRDLNLAQNELEILQALFKPARQAGAEKAVLYYIDLGTNNEPEWVEVAATLPLSDDKPADFPVGRRFRLPDVPWGQLLKSGKSLLIADVSTDSRLTDTERQQLLKTKTQAWVSIPLTRGDRWVGNVQFMWSEGHQFSPAENEIYQTLISLATPVVDNRRLMDNLEQTVTERTAKLSQEIAERQRAELELEDYRYRLEELVVDRTYRLEVVASLSGRLNAILDFDELLGELVHQVNEHFGYYHTQIYVLEGAYEEVGRGSQLTRRAGAGAKLAPSAETPHIVTWNTANNLIAQAASKQRIMMSENIQNDPTWQPHPLLPTSRSEMAVPIILEGEVVGVLDVHASEIAGLDESDASLLRSLANQVAVALRNARLFERAEQWAAELSQEVFDRKQAEQELRIFKTLVENAPDGIAVSSLAGNITYANPAFHHSLGYETNLIGTNMADLVSDDILTQFDNARQQILDGKAWQGYMPHKRADGSNVPIQASSFMIWDDEGNPKAFASVNHDLTEREQAEKALLESQKKFYALYVSMNEALAWYQMIYDAQGTAIDYEFLDINPTYTSMTGLKWEDVVGRRASEVFKTSERLPYLNTYNWVAESGETTSFEATIESVSKVCRVSVFSPAPGQFATILQDISQRKLMEQRMANYNRILEEEVAERTRKLTEALENLKATQSQLVEAEKMAALGGLVAGVAHEINTPVGIGVSMASFLAHETEKIVETVKTGKMKISALKQYLQTATESSDLILNNLNRAAELVQSFKKVAVDQTSLDQRSFQVKPYIEEILLNLRHVLKRTEHRIEVHGAEEITLRSYPGAFSQIISNLVMNSLKHAYEEGDAGYMRFDIIEEDNQLTLTYQDDGAGIPPKHLNKIFDPFFTTARSRGGSGLGLHIVYNLVTQTLHGTIRCESEIGKGTKFIITLPIDVNVDGNS